MTDPTPNPTPYQQPFAGQPVSPYGQPGYPYGGVPVRYEPLPRRHKRAAFWAGGVGLNLMALGSSVVGTLLLVGFFLVFFLSVSRSAEPDSGLQGFDEFLSDVNAPLLAVGIGALGLGIFVLGMFTSVGILRRAEVRRPWAVTWSGFGISIVPLTFLNFFLSFIGQLLFSAGLLAAAGTSANGADPALTFGGVGVAVVIGSVVLSALLVGVVGALAWWWMAHAFRQRVVVGAQPGSA